MSAAQDEYDAINSSVGWIDRTNRLRVEVRGPDRAKFLHNLATNDVKRLAPGRGCEAFVTSPQGKTLAYVSLLVAEEFILLRSELAAWTHLEPHFAKYGLFDDVSITNVSDSTFEWHFAGPRSHELLQALFADDTVPLTDLEQSELAHQPRRLGDNAVRVVRESPTSRAGWTLIGARADSDACRQSITQRAGGMALHQVSAATYDALRIEAGTPEFGRDVNADNLPQELCRDRQAINFVKGCYLGQETVARIDALGHVNKVLRGLRVDGNVVPVPGSTIEADGKPVGTLTSAAFSPGWQQPVALVIVRTAHATAGTSVTVIANGQRIRARIFDLPMPP
jgi:folate-binding protein YgfZ